MMSNKLCKRVISGTKREEIMMRDVLAGLEEIAAMLCYDPWPGDFEIIAIYPQSEAENLPHQEHIVIQSKIPQSSGRPKAKVISYQQQKERLLRLA